MNKRIHAFYSGRVQGVGFRFTAESIAKGLGLTGWVKNLDAGNVEVVAEGDKDALEDFLERIKEYFSHYIRNMDLEWGEASGEFKDFGIEL
ncbi:MAG: acylphosphatase [Candidatus Omnitrophica bacterium]|nr:acylphosphatase [Candidatus Omnitrophota bacterium]MBL7210510.1 acylphosphatase [Candidatus Omnitrophota bacterium]